METFLYRRESTSSTSSGSQIILDTTNPSINKSSKSEVSLILTSSLSSPKSKIFIPAAGSTTEVIHCTLCNNKFVGIDLEAHQRDYCPAKRPQQQQQQQQQQHSYEDNSNGLLSPKRAKLSLVSQSGHHPSSGSVVMTAGKLLYTGGGIVSLSKIGSYNQAGLLQVRKALVI
jgi:hypothetical protein